MTTPVELEAVVRELGKLREAVKKNIMESPFIHTDSRGDLLKDYDKVLRSLLDAMNKSKGQIPPTPTKRRMIDRITAQMYSSVR